MTECRSFKSGASPISLLHSISGFLVEKGFSKVEIYLQGGVRHGTDILKALAFGATAVFLDQEFQFWGLIEKRAGQSLEEMLQMINEELKLAMILTHSQEIKSVTVPQVIEWIQAKPHQFRFKL